jgi:hypothetical protein
VLPSSSSSDRVDTGSRNQEQTQDSEKDGDESTIYGMKPVDDNVKKEWEEVVWLFAERGVLKVQHLKFSSGFLIQNFN